MASTVKKVVAVGDAGCGKASLLSVIRSGRVLKRSSPYITNNVVTIEVDGKFVTHSLWSTSSEKSGRLSYQVS